MGFPTQSLKIPTNINKAILVDQFYCDITSKHKIITIFSNISKIN